MKTLCVLAIVGMLSSTIAHAQLGSTCSNPIPLTLDGVLRVYPTSSSTGNNVICPNTGSSPITYFSFTTNAAAEMPVLDIATPGGLSCEIAMYAGSCSGGNLQSASSMCFYDGEGLWAPAETQVLAANTTYTLRIKTQSAGDIDIAGQFYTPPNDDCAGAFRVGTVPIQDHNACHHGGPGVTPIQLCAFSLENTAFYTYTVAATGISTISIDNIKCDNGATNNSNGFQIGFFTGTCASLTPVNCVAGSGSNIVANTMSLAGGTKVYVAIDGTAGSNCRYSLVATNAEPLSASIKYFTAWKASAVNILKWKTLQETDNDYFEIERSENGKDFVSIGRQNGERNSITEKNYQFVDSRPVAKAFYRLKQVDVDGKISYFQTIAVIRTEQPYLHASFENPVSHNLLLNLQSNFKGRVQLTLWSMEGTVAWAGEVACNKGDNRFYRDFGKLPQGKYILVATDAYHGLKISQPLIKTGSPVFK